MSTEKIELYVDRIEEGITIAYDKCGNKYVMCEKNTSIKEGDIFDAVISECGRIVEVFPKPEETQSVKESLRRKLHDLFGNKE